MNPKAQSILDEIRQSLENINFGSVEIIVQDGQVTQISTRIIKKTNTVKPQENINGVRNLKKKTSSGVSINLKY